MIPEYLGIYLREGGEVARLGKRGVTGTYLAIALWFVGCGLTSTTEQSSDGSTPPEEEPVPEPAEAAEPTEPEVSLELVPGGTGQLFFLQSDQPCVLTSDGEIRCPDEDRAEGHFVPLEGTFVAADASEGNVCGATTTGTMLCSDDFCTEDAPPCSSPDGNFKAIWVSSYFACGIDQGGAIHCFGGGEEVLNPPAGAFVGVSGTYDLACALSERAEVMCWGEEWRDPQEVEDGFSETYVQVDGLCALTVDGNIHCPTREAEVVEGLAALEAHVLVAFSGEACGLDGEGRAYCEGPVLGRILPPNSEFVDIIANGLGACGLRRDETIECWGSELGNGSGPETCLVFETQAVYDDTEWSLWGFVSQNESTRYGDPVDVGASTWLLSDYPKVELVCTPSGSTSKITKNGDEVTFDLEDVAVMLPCPGIPVDGSFSTNRNQPGEIEGEVWLAQPVSYGYGGIGEDREYFADIRFEDGSFAGARLDHEQNVKWGYLVSSYDSPLGGDVLCIGSATVQTDPMEFHFSDLSRLGPCPSKGSGSLSGCSRNP